MLSLNECSVDPRKEVIFHRLMTGPAVPVYVLGRNKCIERASCPKWTGESDDASQ